MTFTAQQVADQLALINTEAELRALINQLDTTTHGTTTVLYSGRIGKTHTSAYINELKNNPDLRVIDNAESSLI